MRLLTLNIACIFAFQSSANSAEVSTLKTAINSLFVHSGDILHRIKKLDEGFGIKEAVENLKKFSGFEKEEVQESPVLYGVAIDEDLGTENITVGMQNSMDQIREWLTVFKNYVEMQESTCLNTNSDFRRAFEQTMAYAFSSSPTVNLTNE